MMKQRQPLLLAAGVALALVVALWPHATYAACDINIGCYVDEGIVTALRFLAQLGWFLNGNLLLVSRWIEEQRNWLIDDVLAVVFDGLLRGTSVAWAQAVVIAVIVFVIGFSLRAVAELNWVDLKRGIRNGVFALIVFTYGAQLMAASENGRLTLSLAAAQMAEDALSTAGGAQMLTGGSSRPGDMMPPTATIYPGARCGGAVPARETPRQMINDTAANYLFATAEDIHCPSESGASENAPALPRVFWEGGEYPTASMESSNGSVNFVGFYNRSPGEAADDEDRKRIVGLAMDGAVRQIFGFFLVVAAVLEQIIQLLFALGLVSLWFSLSIGLVFALFVPTEGMLTGIVRSGIELLKQSVLTTIGVTLVGFVISSTAGSSGVNAGLVAFIGLLALAVLVMLLINTGRVIFATVSDLSSRTLGAAPAAVLGTVAGAGLAAGMALRGNAAGQEAATSAREQAEAAARESGASDKEAKQAGNRAARTAYSSALNASAVRTFTEAGRAVTDAAGFLDDPLRQSMRWQDRAEAERRQKEIIATMELRDEPRQNGQAVGAAAQPASSPAGHGSADQNSTAAQRLRGVQSASASNPSSSPMTALGGATPKNGQAAGEPERSQTERQADAEVEELGRALQRAQQELALVQQQLASAQGRAAVEKPSALNEREVRRLTKEADTVVAEVACLRQQLDEAERMQRQVRGDADAQREQGAADRTWGMVQATAGQRNPTTGRTPQLAVRSGLGLAEQQLQREQQHVEQRPAGDATATEDQAWLQRQQAAVASLRRWNEALADPATPAATRRDGQVAIRQIQTEAERERQVAQQAGNRQREQIAGGVASLADAILPAIPAGAASRSAGVPASAGATHEAAVPASAVPGAAGGAPAARPLNGTAVAAGGASVAAGVPGSNGAATPAGAPGVAPAARPLNGTAVAAGGASVAAGVASSNGAPPSSPIPAPAAPGIAGAGGHSSTAAQRLHQAPKEATSTVRSGSGTVMPAVASTTTPAVNETLAPVGSPGSGTVMPIVAPGPVATSPVSEALAAPVGAAAPAATAGTARSAVASYAVAPVAASTASEAPAAAAPSAVSTPASVATGAQVAAVPGSGTVMPTVAGVGAAAASEAPTHAGQPATGTPVSAAAPLPSVAQMPVVVAPGITTVGNSANAQLGGRNVSPTVSVGTVLAPAPTVVPALQGMNPASPAPNSAIAPAGDAALPARETPRPRRVRVGGVEGRVRR
jgi:hypothetical protein